MEGTYYKEWSRALGREMEFKVYGAAGVPVLAFPCRGGRFYDWENNGMPEAAGWLIEHGRVQLFCADSIDYDGLLAAGLVQGPRHLGRRGGPWGLPRRQLPSAPARPVLRGHRAVGDVRRLGLAGRPRG